MFDDIIHLEDLPQPNQPQNTEKNSQQNQEIADHKAKATRINTDYENSPNYENSDLKQDKNPHKNLANPEDQFYNNTNQNYQQYENAEYQVDDNEINENGEYQVPDNGVYENESHNENTEIQVVYDDEGNPVAYYDDNQNEDNQNQVFVDEDGNVVQITKELLEENQMFIDQDGNLVQVDQKDHYENQVFVDQDGNLVQVAEEDLEENQVYYDQDGNIVGVDDVKDHYENQTFMDENGNGVQVGEEDIEENQMFMDENGNLVQVYENQHFETQVYSNRGVDYDYGILSENLRFPKEEDYEANVNRIDPNEVWAYQQNLAEPDNFMENNQDDEPDYDN